ncbi:MAG: hypothetical protein LJE59_03115, partial [Chromatiaceae bacterium]|nr:hypothetical protein [Chromatiaceae bacterium]
TARSSRVLGLDMYADGFALAVVDLGAADGPVISGVRWCRSGGAGERLPTLKQALKELGARGLPVVATLQHSAYSLVQLEAPELADDELREAMRWRVRDLIDFPVEAAVIDVFRLPVSRRPGTPDLLYAVVAKTAEVEALAELLDAAGLEIRAVDIVEMAIRNLSLYIDRPGRPRAYLHLQPGQTVIEIVDGPQVFLSRRVLQEYEADADPELLQAQMEGLALEVQRSLDYFESQYALGPVDQLSAIVCSDSAYEAFSRVARQFLTVTTERFDFSAMGRRAGIDLATLGRGVTAVGAALRGQPWAA